jgi:acetyl-CoA acetyltransferase
MLTTLVHELGRGGGIGVAAMCGGQASGVVIEV